MGRVELGEARARRASLKCAAAVGALLAAMPWQAALAANAAAEDIFAGLPTVSDEELSDNRGGFSVGKFVVSFGFSVKTSVTGPNITPVTITTNFTVSTPGHLKNLGTQISGAVKNDLQNAGVIDDGDVNTPTLGDSIAKTVTDAVSGIGNNGLKNTSNTSGTAMAPQSTASISPGAPPTIAAPTAAPSAVGASLGDVVTDVAANPPSAPPPVSFGVPDNNAPSTPAAPTNLAGNTPSTAQVTAISVPNNPPSATQAAPVSVAGNLPSTDDIVPAIVSVPSGPAPGAPASNKDTPIATTNPPVAIASSASPPSLQTSDSPQGKGQKEEGPVSDSILPPDAALTVGKPGNEFVATFDETDGSIALSNGDGTDVLVKTLTGHLALVQNTGNDLTIKHQYAANYVIENYHDIVRAAQLVNQLSGVTQQMVVMHGLTGR